MNILKLSSGKEIRGAVTCDTHIIVFYCSMEGEEGDCTRRYWMITACRTCRSQPNNNPVYIVALISGYLPVLTVYLERDVPNVTITCYLLVIVTEVKENLSISYFSI